MYTNSKLLELFNNHRMNELYNALIENTREEALKKAGTKSSDAAIIKRMINDIKKNNPRMYNAYGFNYCGYDLHAITNGCYVIADNSNFGIENGENENTLDMNKIFQDPHVYNNSFNVNIDELKNYIQYIKSFKFNIKDNPYVINTPSGIIGVNPQYLLDVLNYCNTSIIHFQDIKNVNLKTPIFIQSSAARFGLVLPVRLADPKKALQRVEDIINSLAA